MKRLLLPGGRGDGSQRKVLVRVDRQRTLTESDTRGSLREQLHLLKCGDSPEETCGHTVCVLRSGVNLSEQIPTVPNIQAAADKNIELLMVSSPKPKVSLEAADVGHIVT